MAYSFYFIRQYTNKRIGFKSVLRLMSERNYWPLFGKCNLASFLKMGEMGGNGIFEFHGILLIKLYFLE